MLFKHIIMVSRKVEHVSGCSFGHVDVDLPSHAYGMETCVYDVFIKIFVN